MTFALFFIAFITFFIAIIANLPAMPADVTAFTNSFTTIVATVKSYNFLFPITELFICIGIITTALIAFWTIKVVKWTIAIVRGSGTN